MRTTTKLFSALAAMGMAATAIVVPMTTAGAADPAPAPTTDAGQAGDGCSVGPSTAQTGVIGHDVTNGYGSVLGGGDTEVLQTGHETVAYITIGAHFTPKGVTGQVAETLVPAPCTDPADPLGDRHGHYVGDVTCLQIVGNQAYVSVHPRHADGFFDNSNDDLRITTVQYLITDHGGNGRDTVRFAQFSKRQGLITNNEPCNFQAHVTYRMVEGHFEVRGGIFP